MNNSAYELPLTDIDQSALQTAMLSPAAGGAAAKTAALKMVFQIAQNQKAFGINAADICDALSAGSEGVAETALFEALSWEARYLSVWGALVIQAAGVIQVLSWIKNSASFVLGKFLALEQMFVGMMGGVLGSVVAGIGTGVAGPLVGLQTLLGLQSTMGGAAGAASGIPDRRRRDMRRDSSSVASGLLLLASTEAPVLAAVINILGVSSGSPSGQGAMGGGAGAGMTPGTGGTGGMQGATPNTPGTGMNTPGNTGGTGGATPGGTGNTGGTPGTGGTAGGTTGGTGATPGTGGGSTTPGTGSPTTDRRRGRRQDMRAIGINTRRNLVAANTRY